MKHVTFVGGQAYIWVLLYILDSFKGLLFIVYVLFFNVLLEVVSLGMLQLSEG